MSKAKADMNFQDFEKSKKDAAKKAMKKGPVHHMSVEPAEMNGAKGYLTTAHHEPPAATRKTGPGMPFDHEAMISKAFHKTPEEAGSHMSMMMGGKQMIPGTPAAAEESAADGAGDPND
jgi:hypothetical protein